MQDLFSSEYSWLWSLALAAALFFPVRQLIWGLSVRRAARNEEITEELSLRLKKRASVTSILLCFVFSFFYMSTVSGGSQ